MFALPGSCVFTQSGVEVGNLVNPMGHSIDVGFGYERMLQAMEGKTRIEATELFDQSLDPISRDHVRTLTVFHQQGITPGNRGRNYVCRRLIRRFIRLNGEVEVPFQDWLHGERIQMEQSIRDARRHRRKNGVRPDSFYWDTFGVLPEELSLIKDSP